MDINLVVFLDGYSYNYIKPNISPFLYKLTTNEGIKKIKGVFAFRGIGNMIFEGKNVQTSRVWTEYKKVDKNDKIYEWLPDYLLRILFLIDNRLKNTRLRGWLRYWIYWIINVLIDIRIPKTVSLIDFNMIKYLRFADFRDITKTNESIFTKNDFIMVNWPQSTNSIDKFFHDIEKKIEEKTLAKKNKKINIFTKIPYADFKGHELGPDDKKFIEGLKYIDHKFEKLFRKIKHEYGDINFLGFSDTGMIPISKWIDIIPLLRYLHKKYEIIYWVDSTMVRLWNIKENMETKRILKNVIKRYDLVEVTDEKLKDSKLWFNDFRKLYGEIILAVKEGSTFFPDFYRSSNPPKGMHGYAYNDSHYSDALLLTNNFNLLNKYNNEIISFTDVYEIINSMI